MDAALTGRLEQLDAAAISLGEGRLAARRRADAMDAAVRRLVPQDLTRTAVAAVGGYGRSELTPGSDVDLLVVYEHGAEDEAAAVAEAVLYPLWDAGITVGHAVRTPGECVFEARRDLRTLTSLLSARVLDGAELIIDLARDAAAEIVRDDPAGFLAALTEARAERERRFGRIGRVQEPDVKESVGGLRDLQTLVWLEAVPGWNVSRAFDAGSALDTLLAVRIALHRVSGGREDRLGEGSQGAVAAELRIQGETGWEPRDVLMRTLARTGRTVAAALDEALTAAASGEAEHRSPGVVEEFLTSVSSGVWSPEALERFEAVLEEGRADEAITALDGRGLLDSLLPGWSDLAGRPQHDPYHRYPVDLHLTEAAAAAARLLGHADDPAAAAAAGAVRDRGALLLGALLHDAGKVGRGSHVPIGVEVAGRILGAMAVPNDRRDMVLFLVREHLLLSDTATRRNLDDEDLILHVAARVRDRGRLGSLYLLTLADAEATGPSASTPWRLGLVTELVARVDRSFERGLMDPDRAASVEQAEGNIREALGYAGVPEERAERFLEATPPAYALWVEPTQAPSHLDLIDPPPAANQARIQITGGRAAGTASVTVGAQDRLGLLGTIAGAFAVSGISILAARAFTTADGIALDAFDVRGSFEEEEIPQERWEAFATLLGEALDGRTVLAERVAAWRSHYGGPRTAVPVKVTVANDVSDFFTLFEVQAADRLALLFDLATAFSVHDLDVHVARVATYGPRVVDVFYVTEQAGGKLQDGARLSAVREALAKAAAGGAAEGGDAKSKDT